MSILAREFGRFIVGVLVLPIAGCAFLDLRPDRSSPKEFRGALAQKKEAIAPAVDRRFEPPPPAVADALLPDLEVSPSQGASVARLPRFDISVVQANAREFFMGLVADSDYNVIVHPDVKGTITIDLKGVTLPEVLDAVREVYGYDYKKTAAGYVIYPAELMSRLYHVDYLNFVRNGRSETRVSAGANAQSPVYPGNISGVGQGYITGAGMMGGQGYGASPGFNYSGVSGGESEESFDCRSFNSPGEQQSTNRAAGQSSASSSGRLPNLPGSVIATTSTSHFWKEMKQALAVIICSAEGSNFVVNQQSGVIVVRAFAKQLREVEQFLDAIRREVQRQVVLEAKILEVELNDGYQAGIDWASVIRVGQKTLLTSLGGPLTLPLAAATPGSLGQAFTIGINMGDFSAFVELLETQGNVNTLSSPRISTLNNQKAVIKVGTDELHVSNINPGSFANTVSGGGFSPSPILSPYFSGISLDVTPEIDDTGNVTLHVHPSVTQVDDRDTRLDLGTGIQTIPLAISTVRESDSVVHARNGQIVVIGGLMQNREKNDRQGVAWLSRIPGLGSLFRRGTGAFRKSELVILLKPTIIQGQNDWNRVKAEMKDRYERLDGESRQEVLP